jgi:hypothetical protein
MCVCVFCINARGVAMSYPSLCMTSLLMGCVALVQTMSLLYVW